MNIFVTDLDPKKSAENLCDCHVVKMILESCQLLMTFDQEYLGRQLPWLATHKNHPCCVSLSNFENYKWLEQHFYYLLKEYSYRYGKVHRCEELFNKYYKLREYDVSKINFPAVVVDECKGKDLVDSYRRYYGWKSIMLKRFRYTNRHAPDWLKAYKDSLLFN